MLARDFFDSVRAASIDADRCRRQLDQLEERARSLGGGGFEPRTRSTPDPRRMEGRIATYVDMDAKLERRMDDDYALIDRACAVLYGAEQDGRGGLSAHLAPIYSDVLWWRYVAADDWRHVARVLDYSPKQLQSFVVTALEWLDEDAPMRLRAMMEV